MQKVPFIGSRSRFVTVDRTLRFPLLLLGLFSMMVQVSSAAEFRTSDNEEASIAPPSSTTDNAQKQDLIKEKHERQEEELPQPGSPGGGTTSSGLSPSEKYGATTAEGKRQPLLVIGAGYPRTGTLSFTVALKRLGLKSYHMTTGIHDTPGHLALWAQHSRERLKGRPGILPELIQAMAEAGFNSTNDAPASLLYKELLQVYPNARVVLTVRNKNASDNYGAPSWADSMLNSVFLLEKPLSLPPYCWIRFYRDLLALKEWFFGKQLTMGVSRSTRLNPQSVTPAEREALAASYAAWVKDVKATVPEHQLLVFAAKDGWKPLCDFLSHLNQSTVDSACQIVLASGEPYPRINDRAAMQAQVRFKARVAFVTCWLLLPSGCVALVSLVACFAMKRRRKQTPSSKAKAE